MNTKKWKPFPHASSDFDYAGDALANNWQRLHQGDGEPFPDQDQVQSALDENADAAGGASDAADIAAALQDAWRAFHRGDFGDAVDRGLALGPLGNAVASKAAGMYATYLESNDKTSLAIFEQIAEHCESAIEALPSDPANHYFLAFALGRYSQGISIVKALSQGLGGKIKDALDQTLELREEHAEAHTALGLYHAEIIDKVGGMVGKLTYGANPKEAEAHFKRALEIAPDSAIAQIEYANGLLMMHKNKRIDDATDAYVAASEMTPADAMEKLDVELANSELE